MKGKLLFSFALLGVFILMNAPGKVLAQGQGAPPAVTFSEQELDQMLAPVALYPDSLLAQILIAATYPDQVMDADRWLKAHQGLRGDALNGELDRMSWDLSIKALAPFPQVLDMLAQQPDWTQKLGEAFMAQQAAVMDSVQRLRRKAEQAGNLRSTAQQRVEVTDDYVQIQPVDPDYVYVPRYDPAEVYGSWWWPAYPPYAYYPVWPGVVFAPVVGVFGFWGAITVGPAWGWGWGYWGWGGHNVYLNVNRSININTRNTAAINRWQSNYRFAGAHNMAVAGRIGSTAVRTRALGTSRANPAALRGNITSGRVSNGRVVTRSGGAAPGTLGRGTGRTTTGAGAHPGYTGSRPGAGAQGHAGRPSPSQVMNELHGGRTGAGAAGHAGSYGSRSSHGTSSGGTRGSYGGATHGGYTGGSHGSYGGASHGSYGGASHGSYGGASHGSYGGASHGGYTGGSRGSFGGGHAGAVGGHAGGGGGGHAGGGGGHGGGNDKKK